MTREALADATRNGAPRRFDRGVPIGGVLDEFDLLPALDDSSARVMHALRQRHARLGEAIGVIEADLGLTAAVLREANANCPPGRKRPATIPAAVAVIGEAALHEIVADWPVFRPLSEECSAVERLSMHANATRVATDLIARATDCPARDELRVAALLHDAGKLVLARVSPEYELEFNPAHGPPEDRLAAERRTLGLDHAVVGAWLLERWQLPQWLVATVEHHHAADARGPAGVIGLADMLAHHAHGHPVVAESVERAARAAGLDAGSLRQILYELPRAQRGRLADPSPLSPMQEKVLRRLAAGKKYKAIAGELDLSESTIRSHVHALYPKLGVVDRAQAVLLAARHGWI